MSGVLGPAYEYPSRWTRPLYTVNRNSTTSPHRYTSRRCAMWITRTTTLSSKTR